MRPEELSQMLAERLSTVAGIQLKLEPYSITQDNSLRYYEITGKNAELTSSTKAFLVAELCRACPHLMTRWQQELLKKPLVNGQNFIGITEDKRLLIDLEKIPALIFAFDPRHEIALKLLYEKLNQKLVLSPGLCLKQENRQLIVRGENIQEEDFDKISLYINQLKLGIMVTQSTPLSRNDFLPSSRWHHLAFNNEAKTENIKGVICIPLSALNKLTSHFNLDFNFPYLGSQVDNSESYDLLSGLKSFFDTNKRLEFYADIKDAEKILGDLNQHLLSTVPLICKKKACL